MHTAPPCGAGGGLLVCTLYISPRHFFRVGESVLHTSFARYTPASRATYQLRALHYSLFVPIASLSAHSEYVIWTLEPCVAVPLCVLMERASCPDLDPCPADPPPRSGTQDVLYPSEDVEEQLSLLSVYPEPTDNVNGSAEGPQHAGDGMADSAIATASGNDQTGAADCRDESPKAAPAAAVGGLQGKTDEVLKSITDSFATVTDMFGGVPPGGVSSKTSNPDGGSGAVDGGSGGASSAGGGQGGEAAAVKPDGGGWEMFKPPSMAEMKRRLEDMTAGGMPLSPPKVPLQQKSSPGQQSPARTGLSVRGKSREGRSASPARRDPGGMSRPVFFGLQ